ncbi:NAD(P)-dependent oxidoreductase [Aquamicrobium sp. LC103]|uniref:NAD-dependent epimerase/dehydratase family protein n=1 Tax=Aquamicrobium sp. LC103 TaxID=1120658 RepID=UPI00063EBB79|nr:NAD(P)-dependent oxidoreductase [Aquamicrobium sp. LC103]TKT80398.1 NAD(P)-dependent oxidoreductase [Aquamicrobium sp. LC103]
MNGPVTLVSGGTGFVGRFVVDGLLARGHRVTVFGRRPPGPDFFVGPVRFVEGELNPDLDQEPAFEGVEFFVHAAFDHLPGLYRGGEGDDPAGFRERNVRGSNRLFDDARRAGVRRAVFLSSRAVYGTQPPGMELEEETRPHPDTLYGDVKLAVERQLKSLSDEGFAGASLRITGVYGQAGPGREDKWTPLIRAWLEGQAIEPRAGTEVHGEDVAAAVELMLSLSEEAVRGQAFNVSDILVDNSDILSVAARVTDCANALPAPADVSRLNVMNTERLRALGWQPGGMRRFQSTVQTLIERIVKDGQPG